jgi:hypothetical protein
MSARSALRSVSVGFFFDCSLSGWDCFEAFVRNCLAALDREAVGSVGKTRFCTLDRSELLAQVVCLTLVELVLIQLGREVAWIHLVHRLPGVLLFQVGKGSLDPGALGG